MFAEAKEKRAQGFTKEALGLALTAVRQHPSFVAALSFLTELEIMSGNKKRIEKLLQKGWAMFPHPDIAKSFAALAQEESAKDRRARFEVLTKIKDSGPHTILLETELCLAEKDFAGAKQLIFKLEKDDMDGYTHTLMAAIEQGLGANESVVREWLMKAVNAPKSFAWICTECGFQSEWDSVCSKCHCFDSVEWRRPTTHADNNIENKQIPFTLEIGDNVLNVEQEATDGNQISDDGIQNNLNKNIKIDTVKRAREVS